jgi:DNA-binding MarR family transcriptional regulator
MTENEYFQLWVTLNRTKDVLHLLRQKELKPLSISLEQAGILMLLRNSKTSPTPADISRWLFRDRSTVTIALKRMAAKGLIFRNIDPKRKNRLRVTLTEKGKDLSKRLRKNTYITEIFSNLSDSQCRMLQQTLRILMEKAEFKLHLY